MSAKKNEVATKASTAVADMADIFEEDAGLGSEDMGIDDLAIPRLGLLQDASPKVKKSSSERIEGAEAGMILNSATNDCIPGESGFIAIPVVYRRAYIEWYPRNSPAGEGFVADHGTDDSILQKCTPGDRGEQMTEDGTEIVPTAEYFVIVVNPETGATYEAVISMAKSQMKYAKKLNTAIKNLKEPRPDGSLFTPAMFYRSYVFKTKPDSNAKGDDYWSWDISPGVNTVELPNGREIYLAARDFAKRVKEGAVKVHQPSEDAETEDSDAF